MPCSCLVWPCISLTGHPWRRTELRLPDPPVPAATSTGHDSVTITWDDPQDDSITGYRILRRNRDTDALGSFTVMEEDTGSTNTGYTDGTVEPSTRYGYRVRGDQRQRDQRQFPVGPAQDARRALTHAGADGDS